MKLPQETKHKLAELLKSKFETILAENIPEIEKVQGIEEVYANKLKPNKALSRISNDVVQNLMQVLPQKYVNFMLENIEIDVESTEPNISFDTKFEIDPIKPYVDFIVKLDGIEKSKNRLLFEINSDGAITGNKINLSKDTKFLQLGVLHANIVMSLIKMPFGDLHEPKKLFDKNFEVNLSKAF